MVSFYVIKVTEVKQYNCLQFDARSVCNNNVVCMGTNGVKKYFKEKNLTPTSGTTAESKHIVDPMDNTCTIWYEYEAVKAKLYQ
jgi:hypothetical protein